jgi:DNA invertase Pin-like site-specific DNA recombinase
MFRSARDALNDLEIFRSKEISLHFIDFGGDVRNGIRQLVFTILSAVAEQE